jgi:hypothetical protein
LILEKIDGNILIDNKKIIEEFIIETPIYIRENIQDNIDENELIKNEFPYFLLKFLN